MIQNMGKTNLIILISDILLIILISLIIIERKIKKKIKFHKKNRNRFYKEKIKKSKKKNLNPQESLDAINNLAKDFFKEAFDLPVHLEYIELANEFKKTEKKDCATFCEIASELNYSGEKIEKNKLTNLTKLLEEIITKNKIVPKEEEKKEKERENKKEKKQEIETSFIKETVQKKPKKKLTKKPKKKLRK